MAKTVRKIDAVPAAPARLKRVAAYARVSMETERLNHSLSAQVSYYSTLILEQSAIHIGERRQQRIVIGQVRVTPLWLLIKDTEQGN